MGNRSPVNIRRGWHKLKKSPAAYFKKNYKTLLLDSLFFIAGTFLFSISVSMFSAPNNLAPGGLTGIATILHYLIRVPVGTTSLILNIPLFILGLRFIGGEFIIKSIICTVLVSIEVDATTFLPIYDGSHGNMLLAALYGGVLSGIGLALVFLRGGTTGGTDIGSRLFKLKYKHVPMGQGIMILDAGIILLSVVVFKSVDSGLYAMIELFVSARVIDAILYGSDTGKMILVISDKYNEISEAITVEMNRGVTLLKGHGYYTGREREVLLCAVRRPESPTLRAIVRRVDPNAFMIMCESNEVIGEGFKPITKED